MTQIAPEARAALNAAIELAQRMGYEPDRTDVLAWPIPLLLTHTGNAARFAAKYGDRVRFTVGRGWLAWDGKRWAEDVNEGAVTAYMQQIARDWFDQAGREDNEDTRKAIARHASRSLNRDGLVNSLAQATKVDGILARDDDFDADPFILNAQNGIVDLRTGELRPHDPAAMCSRVAGVDYDPTAKAPRWEQFLREIFAGNDDLVQFVRRWGGYCLTGDTREQRYLIAWGDGANGKSTLFDALRHVMGDYAVDISTAALAAKREASNLNSDIARLPGARLAVAPEWDEDLRADEVMLKSLTGQDVISVRTLYQKPFDFRPRCKIVIHGNHKPGLRGSDGGTWRRPLLVPFTEVFTGSRRDDRLADTLKAEAPGILADLVRGCREWQREGLAVPQCVQTATEQYREDSNDVLQFIAAQCVQHPHARATVGKLHAEYSRWGGAIRTAKRFGMALREAGFETERTKHGFQVLGLGIESDG